jgi:thioredoxin 1
MRHVTNIKEHTMGKPVVVTDGNFQETVLDSETPILVDFWAEWCGPCKMIAPVLEEIADEMDGQLTIGKLDVDANMNTAMAYGVSSIPTLLLFKDGEAVERVIGMRQKKQLLGEIQPHIS